MEPIVIFPGLFCRDCQRKCDRHPYNLQNLCVYTLCSIIRQPTISKRKPEFKWNLLNGNIANTALTSYTRNELNDQLAGIETVIKKRVWNQMIVACISLHCDGLNGHDKDMCAVKKCHKIGML